MHTISHLSGVVCATLTPFVSESGAVDDEWIPRHLRFLESHGVHGVLTLGTTGEGLSLSIEERKQVIDLVMKHREGLFVLAGTGCAALPETIALSQYAVEQNVDAVLIVPPFYFTPPTDRGLLHYYRAVCDALPAETRVLLYHIPAVTGVPITPAVIEGLLYSHVGQFFGIKDSSGDATHTAELVRRYPDLHIYSGSDSQVANSLQAGVFGVISAFSNVCPERVRAVFDAHHDGGDVEAAQARLSALRGLVVPPTPAPPALKAMLPWVSDLPPTSVRLPLANMHEEEAARLRMAFENLG